MSDFSHLASPSAAWTEFQEQLSLASAPNFAARPDIHAIRRAINLQRFAGRDEEMKQLGDHGVKYETIMVTTEDALEIPVRMYHPRKPRNPASVLLYFHGGGFFSGSLSTDDATCIDLAAKCGLTVVSAGYRLTPEWKAPTQFQDAWDIRCWMMQNMSDFGGPTGFNLYVMGISAGACLAASLSIRETMLGEPVIRGQCLCAPWLCLPEKFPFEQIIRGKASPEQCRDAALLPYAWVLEYANMLETPKAFRDSPVINPLLIDEKIIADLPPSHIMVCGDDPLRDHGMLFKKKLDLMSVPTKLHVYPGYPHVFRRFPNCPGNEVWDTDLQEGLDWIMMIHETKSLVS